MDKELMNDMPEEENEAVQAPADAEETAADETAQADEETVTETETEELPEELAQEDTEEEESEICPVCETGKVADGKAYCEECEAAMLKRKPPVLAWICGAAVLILSFFALVAVFLVSAPAIQIIKGDIAAENKSWYTAYIEYSEVDSVISEINSILGTSELNSFIQAGDEIKAKLIEAYGKSTNPISAYTLAKQYFTDEEMEKYPALSEYKFMNTEYNTSYDYISAVLDYMMQENSSYETTVKNLESLRENEEVEGVFVDYFSAAVASYYDLPLDKQIESFAKLDEAAKKSGKDYRWLYYKDYAELLIKAGQTDKANAIFDEMIAENKNADDYYSIKIKSLLSAGDIEGAEKTLDAFKVDNEGYDSAYIFEISLLRSKGELDKALELCTEALEIHGTSPELYRQRALIYLLQGRYDEAYEEVFVANSTAYNLYYYYGDSTAYSVELDNTVYVCTYLCDKFGKKDTENAIYIKEILSQYEQVEFSDEVSSIISGEKTVQEVLSEGVHDLV